MAFPIDPNVFRLRLIWTNGSSISDTNNVIYMNDLTNARSAVQCAEDFNTAANANPDCWGLISGNYDCFTIEAQPMDGATAPVAVTLPHTMSGQAGGEDLPGNACVVTLQTLGIGRRRRGRMFLGPVTEGQVSFGTLNPTTVAAVQADFDTLLTALIADDLQPVVASQVGSGLFTAVEHYRVNGYVATQRQRLVRLRG